MLQSQYLQGIVHTRFGFDIAESEPPEYITRASHLTITMPGFRIYGPAVQFLTRGQPESGVSCSRVFLQVRPSTRERPRERILSSTKGLRTALIGRKPTLDPRPFRVCLVPSFVAWFFSSTIAWSSGKWIKHFFQQQAPTFLPTCYNWTVILRRFESVAR